MTRTGRPRLDPAARMVHTAVLLPPAMLAELRQHGHSVSEEIRRRLVLAPAMPVDQEDVLGLAIDCVLKLNLRNLRNLERVLVSFARHKELQLQTIGVGVKS